MDHRLTSAWPKKKLADPFKPELKNLLQNFINQNEFADLQIFVNEVTLKRNIENCETTLVKLNFNPALELEKFLQKEKHKLKNADAKLLAYETILHAKFYKLNHLIVSPWHPDDGIQALIDNLRQYGACYVTEDFGLPYYHEPPHQLQEQFGKRPIFGWNKNQYHELKSGHAILIVGGKRIGNQGYVYFLDPNVNNLTNGKDAKLFKMSYERLLTSICNLKGKGKNPALAKMASVGNLNGPFAVHADIAYLQYLEDFFRAYDAFLKSDTIEEPVECSNVLRRN